MGRRYDYDYIIIGSGPAGTTSALELAKSKKRVAIVEGRFFGGSQLNTRDLPYAVALDFSHTYQKFLNYPEFKNQNLHFNFPTISARQLKTVVESGGNNKSIYEENGITCIKGFANFLDKHTIAVNEKKITSNYFIIATGAKLKTLGIAGTETTKYHTPETAIKLHRLPKVVAVVGAGSTGSELAEYYAELGVKVLLFETAERILPREDQEVGNAIAEYFTTKLGISVLPNCRVTAIEQDALSKSVIFLHEGREKMVRVDCIVLATGSQPTVDYGLENAGVKYKNSGIITNKFFGTSTKNIFAIGDCLGNESSTDRARQEAISLVNNLLGKSKTSINYKGLVRVTNTCPEVATIGLNEDDLLKRDRKYKKSLVKISDTIASKVDNIDIGFVKLLADKNNHIIGACIVSPYASYMASELSMAIRHNLTALEIASTPHIYNSYNQAIKTAAKQLLTNKK